MEPPKSGLQYSYGVEYRALRWIHLLDSPRALGLQTLAILLPNSDVGSCRPSSLVALRLSPTSSPSSLPETRLFSNPWKMYRLG